MSDNKHMDKIVKAATRIVGHRVEFKSYGGDNVFTIFIDPIKMWKDGKYKKEVYTRLKSFLTSASISFEDLFIKFEPGKLDPIIEEMKERLAKYIQQEYPDIDFELTLIKPKFNGDLVVIWYNLNPTNMGFNSTQRMMITMDFNSKHNPYIDKLRIFIDLK